MEYIPNYELINALAVPFGVRGCGGEGTRYSPGALLSLLVSLFLPALFFHTFHDVLSSHRQPPFRAWVKDLVSKGVKALGGSKSVKLRNYAWVSFV